MVPWHLAEAARLAHAFPDIEVILNHTGLPADRSAEGMELWRSGMRAMAGAENVCCKISGLGQPDLRWSTEQHRDVIRETIDIFGVGRCMFASNYPVESLYVGLEDIFLGFSAAVADFSADEREALFSGNAHHVYRL